MTGGALRLALPAKLVMVYKGYELVDAAANFLAVPRYGAGSLVLHRAAFAVVPPDHISVIALHGLASMVSLALLPLALGAVLRGRPGAAASVVVAAWGLAVCPQLVVDARSESILTLGVACVAVAWLLAARWWAATQGQRHPWDLVGALAALALAATIRPELIVFGPAALALHRWLSPPAEGLRRSERAALILAVAAATLLLVPHAIHIATVATAQVDHGALPGLGVEAVLGPLTVPLTRNALWRIAIFPTPWLLLLLVWAWRGADAGSRRASLALAAFAAASTALVAADLPDISLPRLHAAAAAWMILALAPAAVAATQALHQSWRRAGAAWLIAVAAAAAAVPSAQARTQTTTEDDEDTLLRDLRAALPGQSSCVAMPTYRDDPATRVHRQYPEYLFRPPLRSDRLLPLRAMQDGDGLRGCRELYVYLGSRCWLRNPDASGRVGMVDDCRAALEAAHDANAELVLERQVPNRRTDGFGWAGDDATLTLRVLRIRAARR